MTASSRSTVYKLRYQPQLTETKSDCCYRMTFETRKADSRVARTSFEYRVRDAIRNGEMGKKAVSILRELDTLDMFSEDYCDIASDGPVEHKDSSLISRGYS